VGKRKKTRKRADRQGRGRLATINDLDFGGTGTRRSPRFADLVGDYLDGTTLVPKNEDLAPARVCRRPVAALDLHGKTAVEAQLAVESFLLTHRRLRSPAVRIVTGKGLHSPDRPVLKEMMDAYLRLLDRQGEIVSFHWEGDDWEEAGAVIVVLDDGGCRPHDTGQ